MKYRTFLPNMTTTLGSACRLPLFSLTLIFLMVATFGLSAAKAQAQTYVQKTLHSFAGGTDGVEPEAGLVNVNGVLYGITYDGGTSNVGTIFSVNPDSTGYQTLYTFQATSSTDGASPAGGLLLVNGKLYGTTSYGGSKNDGTLFSFDPATNKEKTLYSFLSNSSSDGTSPNTCLINVNGLLYGVTYYGGSSDDGTIFSFDPINLNEAIVHNFTNSGGDGAHPYASLLAINNVLYGATTAGGTAGFGIVFSLDLSSGVEHILHTFTSSNLNEDGSNPDGGLILLNNVLYGTTFYGGNSNDGTVFSINPDGSRYQVIYNFTDTRGDGYGPFAGLIAVNGLLYGTTEQGGIDSKGMVFAVDPVSGNETVLYDFSDTDSSGYNPDGANLDSGLVAINGTLYGTTLAGGTSSYGTIFSLTPVTVPTANTDGCTIAHNKARTNAAPGVLGNDLNGGEGPLTAVLVSNVSHGTLSLHSDGSFTYTPNTGYAGKDVFTYQAVNPVGHSNTTTCTFTVLAGAPIANTDGATIKLNTARTFAAPGVLGNDDNGGEGPLTATLVSNVSHGTLSFHSDGSFVYTPNTGYIGKDVFTYQAVNPVGKSNTTTCTLTVVSTPTAKNDGATIAHNTARTFAAPGVLSNDNNGGANPMTAALVTNVSHGTLTLHSDGSFVYTPKTGYSGTDTFTYQAVNSIGKSNIATVTLTVQ